MIAQGIERQVYPMEGFEIVEFSPVEPINEVPIILAPAFASDARSYVFTQTHIAELGYTSFSFTFDTRNVVLMDVLKRKAILDTARAYGALSQFGGPRQVDVIAQSKGAIDTIMVAKDHPDFFRNFVLVAPDGIHPPLNPIASARRLKAGSKQDDIDKERVASQGGEIKRILDVNKKVVDEYKRNPFRYNLEALTSAWVTIPQHFDFLRERGIGIAVIAMLGDGMFPLRYFTPLTEQDQIDNYIILTGIHPAIKFDPKVVEVAVKMLVDLEQSEH